MATAEVTICDRKAYFKRERDEKLLFDIIKEDRERKLEFFPLYNVVYITYWTGKTNPSWQNKSILQEVHEYKYFGVGYKFLDEIIKKYGSDPKIMLTVMNFCLRSKSKHYWDSIRDTDLGRTIMSAVLGARED